MRRLPLIPFFILLFSCDVSQFKAEKLILISFDGAHHSLIQKYFAQNPNSSFGKVLNHGFFAERNIMVTPSLTAVSHMSMITGAEPSHTGIVSNTFHKTSDHITQTARGFSEPIEVETFWEKAMAQGKRVGVISYPGCTATGKTQEEIKRRTASWGMPFPEALSFSSVKEWTEDQFTKGTHIKVPAPFRTYNIPQVISINFKDSPTNSNQTKKIYFILLDTTNDKTRNYDFLVVDEDTNLSNGVIASASDQEWFKIAYTSQGQKRASFCKLLGFSSIPLSLKVYVGSLNYTTAYPEEFYTMIEKELGPASTVPDHFNIHKTLTEDDYFMQAEKFSEYLHSAIKLALKKMDWDILLLYIPITDEVQHQFNLIDPRQKGFEDSQKVKQYADYVKRGYEFTNTVLNDLMEHIDKAKENIGLVVVSDHGMAPIWSLFYPNRVLKKHGFIQEAKDGKLNYLARAVASGGTAHLYLNIKGREKDGVVDSQEYSSHQSKIAEVFSQLKDSEKQAIFEHVLIKPKNPGEQMPCILHRHEKFDLNHPTNTGDVVLIATPGFHLMDQATAGQEIEPSTFFGQHGYDSYHPEMAGIFYMYGREIAHSSIPLIQSTDIFSILVKMLDLK